MGEGSWGTGTGGRTATGHPGEPDFPALLRETFPALGKQPGAEIDIPEAPELRHIVTLGASGQAAFTAEAAVAGEAAAIAIAIAARRPPPGACPGTHSALICYTSGTTAAAPKGAMISHEAFSRVADGVIRTRFDLTPMTGCGRRCPCSTSAASPSKFLMWSGEAGPADEAARAGLVQKVVPAAALLDEALALADRVARCGPIALGVGKRIVNRGVDRGEFDYATEAVSLLFGTADVAEGIAAFRDKRPPQFTGE